jgi:hypothetical protein
MGNPNSLINIGELAKPANTLIEKIADAVEGIAKPAQIKRVAKAQAEANKILALSDIEINELQQRALTRFVLEETKKQENMETILLKSLPKVTKEAQPEQINRDWIVHFFDKCRLISDNDMQNLWAQVLAGQANSPGSFSKRTVDVLANLEQSDAVLFTKLCSFAVITLPVALYPLIYDPNDVIYATQGMKFPELSHLESLGLIHFNNAGPYELANVPQTFPLSYFDFKLQLEFPRPLNVFKAGRIMLTKVGRELIQISDAKPIDGFTDYLLKKWEELGYKAKLIPNDPAPDEVAAPTIL